MKSKVCARKLFVTSILATGLVGLFVAGSSALVSAAPLHRFSAEFQNTDSLGTPEVSTTATPLAGGAGGTVVYDKTLSVPFQTVYVTFSATGETHNGAALLMTALVDGVPCEAFEGRADAGPSGWITLQKLPQPGVVTNCNDDGGGSADCHDNNLYFSCCAQVENPPTHNVQIKLASSNGSRVFYERATIYIDGSPNPGGDLCQGVSTAPH